MNIFVDNLSPATAEEEGGDPSKIFARGAAGEVLDTRSRRRLPQPSGFDQMPSTAQINGGMRRR